jgi:putative sigma-54 modulation protein
MNVEYTGRQCEITSAIREEVEVGLAKIRKILHDKFETKVVLSVEKKRHQAEIAISPRNGPLIALVQAGDMSSAIHEALDHLERKAIKYATKWRTTKRHNHKSQGPRKWIAESKAEPEEIRVVTARVPSAPLLAHWFPPLPTSPEVHLVRSEEGVAKTPLTLEEAIKEAHFRDRDVFVFRDPKGKVMVLHRTRDGRMELIEAP